MRDRRRAGRCSRPPHPVASPSCHASGSHSASAGPRRAKGGKTTARARNNLGSLFGMEDGDAAADSNDALRYERPRPPAAPTRSAAGENGEASPAPAPAPAEGASAAAKPTQFAFAGQVHGLYRFDAAANGFQPVTDTGPFGVVLVGTCRGAIPPRRASRPRTHTLAFPTAGAGVAYSLIVYNAAKQYIIVTPVDDTVRWAERAARGCASPNRRFQLRLEAQGGTYVSFTDGNNILYSLAFPTVEAADAFRLCV